ncbi:hypothetical protein PDJAM_G00059630 [Pangasius djambal]|uniref:Uncharacterized protein n=1 Tax=Pangasius djambal TaxID=1691987 RepID=A0ACC5YZN8_9TELE|nr:hypothetical protein [Pangasius djambal]
MIIENVDALKSWLAKLLEPICDADPSALANYVVALVKKDKPEKDLRALCADQLDVFLQKGNAASTVLQRALRAVFASSTPSRPRQQDVRFSLGPRHFRYF